MRGLRAALSGPRAWLTLGMLLPRASGFLTGLLLARIGGAAAVGVYSAVMNTAAPLVAPLSHAMINTNNLMAGEAAGGGLRPLWRAHLVVLGGAFALGLPAFLWLHGRATAGAGDAAALSMGWALLGAAAVIVGQLGTPMVAALLHGEGRFVRAGQLAVLSGAFGLLAAVPVILWQGLSGALGLAAVVALFGWGLLSADLLRRHAAMGPGGTGTPLRDIGRRLGQALPAMAGMGLNGAVNWLCMIVMAGAHWQAEGVGVVGIALQWSTLMLIPATSWGGMNLQRLGEARRAGDRAAADAVLRALLLRNVGATAAVAAIVAAGSGLLERLYGLPGSGLRPALVAFCAAAVVSSANAVFEKYWWAAGRQSSWFGWSCAGLAAQLVATVLLLPRHVALAGVGVLAYGLVLGACSALAWRRERVRASA